MAEIEIYNLEVDPGETDNLVLSHSLLVEEMLDFMKKRYNPATQRKPSERELSEETRKQFRPLGYIKWPANQSHSCRCSI